MPAAIVPKELWDRIPFIILIKEITYGIECAGACRSSTLFDELVRSAKEARGRVRGQNDQVEGPLYQEARKSTVEGRTFHFTNEHTPICRTPHRSWGSAWDAGSCNKANSG